jgi:hypothetical protein
MAEKQSQSEWILARLRQGPVTAMDALDGCGCFRLAARIKDLRDAGYDIQTDTIELLNGKHVAQYQLKEKETATC